MAKLKPKKILAFMLALSLLFTTAFNTGVISADAASKKAVKTVTVKIGSKNVTKKTYKMEQGASAKLKVTAKPASAKKSIAYKSSKKSVASVSKKGKVTAKAAGTAKITVTVKGKNGKKKTTWLKVAVAEAAPVTTAAPVATTAAPATTTAASAATTAAPAATTEAPVAVTGVELDSDKLTMTVNQTSTLKEIVIPASATNRKVTWTSSDVKVATVENGKVTAKSEGSAIIKVTTDDGGYTATCAVEVKSGSQGIADTTSVQITNAIKEYSDSAKNDYVLLAGQNADVRVRILNEAGSPVGNKKVTLSLIPQYGNCAKMCSLDDRTATTDSDGYVQTVVVCDENNLKPTDGYYQSYTLKASLASDNSVSASAIVSFAAISACDSEDFGIRVLNGTESDDGTLLYPDIVPGLSATKAHEEGITYSESTDGLYKNQYVTSQQANNEVVLYTTPYLVIPPKASEVKTGVYQEKLNNSSGAYSLYNDEKNEKTTTQIMNIPAGLSYANINFRKIVLSDYTKLAVKFFYYDEETETEEEIKDYEKTITCKNLTENSMTVKIPVKDDVSVKAVISLVSAGQIDLDNNTGYDVADIVGEWKKSENQPGRYVELKNHVEWEKVDTKNRADGQNLSYGQMLDYCFPGQSDETQEEMAKNVKNLNKDYTYIYDVPQFPGNGNAFIYAKNKNNETVAYFSFPSRNQMKDGKWQNVNEIINPSSISKKRSAYEIEEKVVKNSNVGTISANGNIATVNSKDSGITTIKATLKLSDFDSALLKDISFYSSVQWAPEAIKSENTVMDFYALEGQSVNVKAKLMDAGFTNETAQSGLEITYSNADGNYTEYVPQTSQLTATTDKNGECNITFKSDGDYNFLKEFKAKSKNYNVKLYVGDIECNAINIHWVKAGLYFKDRADIDTGFDEVTAIDGANVAEPYGLKRETGTKWGFGFKVIGKLPEEEENSNYEVAAVEGLKVNFSRNGCETEEVDVAGVTDQNGVIGLCSEKTGRTELTGKLDDKSITDQIKFVIVNKYTKEIVGTYANVGTGTSSLNAKIQLNIDWIENGLVLDTVTQSSKLAPTTATHVYVNVHDSYGNPYKYKDDISYTIESKNYDVANILGLDEEDINSDNIEIVKDVDGRISKITVANKKTNESGVIDIPLAAPLSKGSLTVSANSGEEYQSSPLTITYSPLENHESFVVKEAKLTDDKTIAITFNNALDKDSLNKAAFKVRNNDENVDYMIESLTSYDGNDASVILKLKSSLADVSLENLVLSISNYTINGYEHQILDDSGYSLEKDEEGKVEMSITK